MKVFYELLNDYRDCLIRGDHMGAGAAYIALMSENDDVQSRLESLEKDAARYRWIASQKHIDSVLEDRYCLFGDDLETLDAAIDAAMQANKGE